MKSPNYTPPVSLNFFLCLSLINTSNSQRLFMGHLTQLLLSPWLMKIHHPMMILALCRKRLVCKCVNMQHCMTHYYQACLDDELEDLISKIQKKYKAGTCKQHPDLECFHHHATDLHFDLRETARVASWANHIVSHGHSGVCNILIYIACWKSNIGCAATWVCIFQTQ